MEYQRGIQAHQLNQLGFGFIEFGVLREFSGN